MPKSKNCEVSDARRLRESVGKRHREKVGRKSDAIKLYWSRKAVDPNVQFSAPDVAVATCYIVESWADTHGVGPNVKEKASGGVREKEWRVEDDPWT